MRSRPRRRHPKIRQKGIYILPNLFTSASLFGGFYAIVATIHGRYEAAAIAMIISSILDGLDGRIARLTKTSSHFGTEYDSLSDLVAFGIAPGIAAFLWALQPFGRLGWLAAFMYVICGALRLARFNVQKNYVEPNYFKGLPIPAAACFIASLILVTHTLDISLGNKPYFILFMVYLLSFLMVSSIRYFSFKQIDMRDQKPFNVLVSTILVFIVIAYKPTIMFFIIMIFYVLSGPVAAIHRFYLKRAKGTTALSDTPSLDDEDDLRPSSSKNV